MLLNKCISKMQTNIFTYGTSATSGDFQIYYLTKRKTKTTFKNRVIAKFFS